MEPHRLEISKNLQSVLYSHQRTVAAIYLAMDTEVLTPNRNLLRDYMEAHREGRRLIDEGHYATAISYLAHSARAGCALVQGAKDVR